VIEHSRREITRSHVRIVKRIDEEPSTHADGGLLHDCLYSLVGGLRSIMGYAEAANLEVLRTRIRLMHITNARFIESHPHDVVITKESPNYQVPRSEG
jgi:IMP dehydrogenase/GMP reductase